MIERSWLMARMATPVKVLRRNHQVAPMAATAMMALMWIAEYPLAQHTSSGEPTSSTNPITDYHYMYALGAIVVALTYAGHTWGLGRWWAQLPFVQRHRWLI